MTLDNARKGQVVRVLRIPEPQVRAQAIRFGVAEGQLITCSDIVPAGPVVIRRNRQEIAVGRRLASRIEVEPVGGATGGELS